MLLYYFYRHNVTHTPITKLRHEDRHGVGKKIIFFDPMSLIADDVAKYRSIVHPCSLIYLICPKMK